MRADIYITNTSDKTIAVGMTVIAPGKTGKVLKKDFERKASYVDRMIKEKKLSFPKPGVVKEDIAPATDDLVEGINPLDTTVNEQKAGESEAASESEGEKADTNEADALTSVETEETTIETETETAIEADAEVAPEVEEELKVAKSVSAPKRAKA